MKRCNEIYDFIKTKQLTKRRYGPVMDSSQYRATLERESVTTIPMMGSTTEDELLLE